MPTMNRRAFLRSTAALIPAVAVTQSAKSESANERVRHAVIGVGGQGRQHCKLFSEAPNCDVVAVCDVDPEYRASAANALPNTDRVRQEVDYRRILEDTQIDTVSIATPDHWHTPIALAALQAGKHVYVEKPCSHNIREGLLLAQAAAEFRKCVQHGTQSRSGAGIRETITFLHQGGIGKVRVAKAINHQFREAIGRAPESAPPDGVDYDRWLGPAPNRPFTQNRWHYNWHWHWDYGTGDIGNDGIHQMDVARWGLGAGWPKAVSASGGQLFYDDDHETPDTQVVTYEYDDAYLIYEMRLWTDYKLEGHDNGVVYYGDKGRVDIGRDGCFVTLKGEETRQLGGGADIEANVRNFLDCVRGGDPSALNAPIAEGQISAGLCHLGNIATRIGRRLNVDPKDTTILHDDEASALLSRDYRAGYELSYTG